MTQQLPAGYTCRYQHLRDFPWRTNQFATVPFRTTGDLKRRGLSPATKGGMTVCHVYDPSGEHVLSAWAHCNPKDNFNRKIGRQIALGRAVKAVEQRTPALVEALAAVSFAVTRHDGILTGFNDPLRVIAGFSR